MILARTPRMAACPPAPRACERPSPAGAAVYLDHAATTPMLPEAIAAMTEELGQVGNPSSLHDAGPPGPPGGRGVPGADRRGVRRPAQRGRVHQRRHRGRQPGDQGPVLGPPRGRPAAAHGPDRRRSSTTRCSTRPPGWPARGRRASTGCRSTTTAWSPRRAARRDRAGPGRDRADQRDVGEQRGRHGAADRRAGRGRPRVPDPVPQRRGPGRRPAAGRAWPAAAPPR